MLLTYRMQGVLRSHLDDLAGHHTVLRIDKSTTYFEPTGFNTYMRVDRTPLTAHVPVDQAQSSAADDPVARTLAHSKLSTLNTWENINGWLRNLQSTMNAEQIVHRVDALHPKGSDAAPSAGGVQHWACPLKRLSFWTKVTDKFSPLVPSPPRSARLFGNEQVSMASIISGRMFAQLIALNFRPNVCTINCP